MLTLFHIGPQLQTSMWVVLELYDGNVIGTWYYMEYIIKIANLNNFYDFIDLPRSLTFACKNMLHPRDRHHVATSWRPRT